MITLTDFKNNLMGIIRPNRFSVSVNPPSIYEYTEDLDNLKFLAQKASIPSRTQTDIPMKFHGMELKLPGDYSHDDLTIEFINSGGDTNVWAARDLFEGWLEVIQNVALGNLRSDYKDLSDATIEVIQLDNNGDNIATYRFYDVILKNVSEIELNMGTNDSLETFTVIFAYTYWEQIG